MAPLVPDIYLEARRNQIIDAAIKCFSEKGFHKATMKDVCKTADLSTGAVYNYFRSKEDIIAAAAERDQEQAADLINAAATTDSRDPLVNVIKTILSIVKEQDAKITGLNLELYSESSRNPRVAEPTRKNLDAALVQIVKLVERNKSEGIFNNKLDSSAIARVLTSFYFGLMVQKIIDPETDVDAYISVCEAIIHGSFSKEARKGEENASRN